MAKDFAKDFYNSKEWHKCRLAYIKHRLGLCEICGQPGLIVHHKRELSPENIDNPAVTMGWDNLEFVCQSCHNQTHGSGQPFSDEIRFTENGDVVKRGEQS